MTKPDPPLDDLRARTGLTLTPGVPLRTGPRAVVWRHRVESVAAPADTPARGETLPGHTVIVKRSADPDAPTTRRERAAYAALARSTVPVPRCLAHTEDSLVLADAPGDPLAPRLEQLQPATLRRVARALGQAHAHARAAGASLPDPPAFQDQAQVLRDAWPKIASFLDAADVPAPGVRTALTRLADAVATPAPGACTLTFGDMAPSNVLVSPDRVTFVDLEYAGLREPFYDAMFWRLIVPLPPALAATLDADYHAALTAAGWALSDQAFAAGRARAAAHRLFWTLSWGLDALFERDWPVVPDGPGMRSVLVGYLTNLRAVVDPLDEPALAETAARLHTALAQRWA